MNEIDTTESRDQEDILRRIEDSAEKLFAQKGFSATSVREITAAAGCNVASINYYYGSKKGLYERVLKRYLENMCKIRIAAIDEVTAKEYDIRDLVEAFCESFLESLKGATGELGTSDLLLRECLDPALEGSLIERMVNYLKVVREKMIEAIKRIYPELSSELLDLYVISIIGQLWHFAHFLTEDGQRHRYVMNPLSYDIVIDHVTSFSVAALENLLNKGGQDAQD